MSASCCRSHILSNPCCCRHPAVAYISYCSILTSAVFKFKKMKSYQGYTDGPFYQLTEHTHAILFVIFSSLFTFTTEIQNSHKIRNFSKCCMSASLLSLLSCYSVQFLRQLLQCTISSAIVTVYTFSSALPLPATAELKR